MICPKDNAQCVQYNDIGDGMCDDTYYHTSEVKYCPVCESLYVEFYSAFEIDGQDDLKEIVSNIERSLRKVYKLVEFQDKTNFTIATPSE